METTWFPERSSSKANRLSFVRFNVPPAAIAIEPFSPFMNRVEPSPPNADSVPVPGMKILKPLPVVIGLIVPASPPNPYGASPPSTLILGIAR